MRDAERKLDAKEQRALVALLEHETIKEAAKGYRLSEATLYRYLSDATFKAHYSRARSSVVEHAITQLQRDCATATKTLREVAEDGDAPTSARVSAAKAILEGAIKSVELHDLMARVEALEAKGGAQGGE